MALCMCALMGTSVQAQHSISNFQMSQAESANGNASLRQQEPMNPTAPTTQAMWDIQFDYDLSVGSNIGGGLAGAIYTGNEFWVSQWNSDTLIRYDAAGNFLQKFTLPGVAQIRGMTWDGVNIYAGNASGTVYQIDVASQVPVGTITLPAGVTARFITYDASADAGNGGFWVGNFNTDITLVSRTGTALLTIGAATHGLTGMYGAAYDGVSVGGPYLWVFHQPGTPSQAVISQVDLATGMPTGVIRDAAADFGLAGALAGGLFISTGIVAGQTTLGGVLQSGPDHLFGYELDFSPIQFDLNLQSFRPDNGYTIMPVTQIAPIMFDGEVVNQGLNSLDSVTVTVRVENYGTVVYTDSILYTNMASVASQTFSIGPFTPASDTGFYEVFATTRLAVTQPDQGPSNNDFSYAFIVSDSTYARDDATITGSLGVGAGPGVNSILGQNYTLANPGSVTSVSFFLNGPTSGDSIYVSIYDTDATSGTPMTEIGTTDGYVITDADTNGVFLTLPVNGGGLALNASEYFFGVNETGSNITLATTTTLFTAGKTWLNWDTNPVGGWANNETFNFNVVYVLRPNFGYSCEAYDFSSTAISADSCMGDNGGIQLNVAGGSGLYTYSWDTGDTGANVSGLTGGTYTVTITGLAGCDTMQTFTIPSVGTPPTLQTAGTDASCGAMDGMASVSVTSGNPMPYMYMWSDGQVTDTAMNLAAGTYTVMVTDNDGCSASASVSINDAGGPSIDSAIGTDIACNGDQTGMIDLTVSGGAMPYSYAWSTGDTTADLNGLAAGTYTLNITDGNGCIASTSVTISEPTALTASTNEVDVLCNGDDNGAATLTVGGGTPGYSFSWSTGATSPSINGLMAGSYTCDITDANGCMISASATITEPAAITATANATDVTCFGDEDGSVSLSDLGGGTAPFSYSWDNGETTQDITGVGGGTYTVTIVDGNGCSFMVSADVIEASQALVVTVTEDNANGTAMANPVGGVMPYSYSWNTSPAQTTQTATGLAPGNYVVTVTDANGCEALATAAITVSIEDMLEAGINSIEAFPNPSNGSFTLRVELAEFDDVNVEVLDMTGKRVFSQTHSHINSLEEAIEVNAVPAGIYMLRVATSKGMTHKPLIIK